VNEAAASDIALPAVALTGDDRRLIRREVILLAWPVVLQSLLRTLMFLVDTAMLGNYGTREKAELATAAMAVIGPIGHTMAMVLGALGAGALATVARATGAGDRARQEGEVATAFAMGLIVSAALVAPAMFLIPQAVGLFRLDAAARGPAMSYLFFIGAAVPFMILESIGSSALRGAGDTRMPMIFGIAANLLNVVGNYVLIFGTFGAPEMGVAGAGLSTAASLAVQALLTVAWMRAPGAAARLPFAWWRGVTRESTARLLRVTAPATVEPLLLQSGFLLFIGMMATLGAGALAAHRTAVAIESIAFMPGFGFSIACGAIVGQCLGARRPERAEEGFRVSARLAFGVMATTGVVFLAGADLLVRALVTLPPEAERAAATCLRVSALELPFLALAMVLGGALRGAGDTKTPMIVAAVGVWLIRIPLSYVLAIPLGLGIVGAWITMVVDWGARTALFWTLWKRGHWRKLEL
jgi:putative MATE family efflux protein